MDSDSPSNNGESWDKARRFAAAFTPIPSIFSACIRTVNKVEAILDPSDNDALKEFAVGSAEFLVRVSPTLNAVFYFAAKRLYPVALQELPSLDAKRLLHLFEPREVATIIGLTFVYRKVARSCTPKDWLVLNRKIQVQMEIGYALGKRMELVGSAHGMLLGAIRFLSVAAFAAIEPQKYSKFRSDRIVASSSFDLEGEEELFGCNHMQVASLVLQSLGFTMPRSSASVSLGLSSMRVTGAGLPDKLRTQVVAWQAALEAIDRAHKSGEFMTTSDSYQLRLPPTEEAALKAEVAAAVKTPSFEWISRTKSDLPPDIAAKLRGESVEDALG